MIAFTPDEEQLIARLSVASGWDRDEAAPLKKKIKDYLLAKASHCCCYCRRSMHQWHRISIDIEHVLPKGKFPQYTFRIVNLNVSCKRCNMTIKGEDTSFFLAEDTEPDPFKSEYYRFIHPNCDVADEHLMFLAFQFNTMMMVKYKIVNGSAKGAETYDYFDLRKLEINSFDEAQGLITVTPSESLPVEFAQELKTVLDSIHG